MALRFRRSTILLMLLVSGCSLTPPQPQTLPEPDEQPQAAPQPAPSPPPRPQPAPERTTFAPKVAVVLTSRAPAYERVALALDGLLEDTEVYDLSDRSLSARDAFAAIDASGAKAVVAIGLRAAVYARNFSQVPVVFSQVFNVAENELVADNVRGVAAIPPLARQLEEWRKLTPALDSVGAIVGKGHERLLDDARVASAAHGVTFHHRIASSDRETLYLFTRMLPQIDGFWLFPDNRILSAEVLRDMLSLAARHGVQVTVFNDSLLDLGATFSATSSEEDIALVVMRILTRIDDGDIDSVPELSPLNELRMRVSEQHSRTAGPVDNPAGAM